MVSTLNTHHTTPLKTRVVKNRRWIHSNQLKMGMYVRELDRPWEETHFMFQGFEVDDLDLLLEVQQSAEYVCIETEKLAHISETSTTRLCGASRL